MTVLNKREILKDLSWLGERLRIEPKQFISMQGSIDTTAAIVRLNRLGKCINIGLNIVINYNDGFELTKEQEERYQLYRDYLKECQDAFEMGRSPK